MGTIIALGGGNFANGEMRSVAEKIIEYSGRQNPKVLFLPTAGFDDMNGDEPIRGTFLSLGCTFEPLLLTDASLTREQIEEAILSCDIVYAGGGNLQFLMDTWTRTGAADALRKAYDRGVVLSGFSSGAMCWFAGGYDDCGPEHSFVFLRCLGLLPHIYCPHFISEVWQRFGTRIRETGRAGSASRTAPRSSAATTFTASSPAMKAATRFSLTERTTGTNCASRTTRLSSRGKRAGRNPN